MSSDAAAMSSDAPLFLTHAIAKTDSLATIAVKYGVTIRDVKRANGGMITDATLHARASVRIPRTALAEGAPLPGGGGLTGAARPKTGSAALEEMREYYGTTTSAGRLSADVPSKTSRSAYGAEDGPGATRAFTGGTQTATKLTREVRSGAAPNEAPPRMLGGETNIAASGGGVSALTFQSRDRALMSPPTTRTAAGTAAPVRKPAHASHASSSSSFFPAVSVGSRSGSGASKAVAGLLEKFRNGVSSLAADAGASASFARPIASASERKREPPRVEFVERKGKGD
jgi:LysM repeat protein